MTALWDARGYRGDARGLSDSRSRLLETLNAAPDEETTSLYKELRDRARTPSPPLPSRSSGIPARTPLTPSLTPPLLLYSTICRRR